MCSPTVSTAAVLRTRVGGGDSDWWQAPQEVHVTVPLPRWLSASLWDFGSEARPSSQLVSCVAGQGARCCPVPENSASVSTGQNAVLPF